MGCSTDYAFRQVNEIDFDLHLGIKWDYKKYFNTKQLRHSELTLLQNQYELERTQMLSISMLALQNKTYRLYANWKQVYISVHRWKYCLVALLTSISVACMST